MKNLAIVLVVLFTFCFVSSLEAQCLNGGFGAVGFAQPGFVGFNQFGVGFQGVVGFNSFGTPVFVNQPPLFINQTPVIIQQRVIRRGLFGRRLIIR